MSENDFPRESFIKDTKEFLVIAKQFNIAVADLRGKYDQFIDIVQKMTDDGDEELGELLEEVTSILDEIDI